MTRTDAQTPSQWASARIEALIHEFSEEAHTLLFRYCAGLEAEKLKMVKAFKSVEREYRDRVEALKSEANGKHYDDRRGMAQTTEKARTA